MSLQPGFPSSIPGTFRREGAGGPCAGSPAEGWAEKVRRARGAAGGSGRAGRPADSWAPCAGLLAAARPVRSAPAATRGVEGGCRPEARSEGCVCAGVSARPLPGIPPQPGQRGAFPRGERRVPGGRPALPLPGWLGPLGPRPWGAGGAGNPRGAVSACVCVGGRRANMEARRGLPSPRIARRLVWAHSLRCPCRAGAQGRPQTPGGFGLGPFEVGRDQNPLAARMPACGRGPSAGSKLLPLCSRRLRLTGLNHQNGES